MEIEAEPTKQRVSSYLYFGSLYFITVGVLYLWGYWPRFDINILEYISLADVLKLTAYPIASTVVFILLGAAIGEFLVDRAKIPPGGGRDTAIGRFLNRFSSELGLAYVVGTGALLVFAPESKWEALLPVLIAVPIWNLAKARGVLIDILPHERTRSIVVYMLAVLPMWAYGHGRLEAFKLLEGKDYIYLAISTTDGIKVGDPNDPKTRVKYIGHVNDYVFLLLADNTTLAIVPFDKTRGLQLRRFRSADSPAPEGSNSRMQPTPKSGAADAKR